MNQGDNRNGNMPDQQQQQSSSQWTQVIGQVIEKLTGTNMSTTISFANGQRRHIKQQIVSREKPSLMY